MKDSTKAASYRGEMMRISDLSRQTGVPVPTIKFYLRERLLPPGTPTGRNQADYSDPHLRRLRLIRAFTSIGHLDLSSVRAILSAMENDHVSLPDLYQVVDRALVPVEPTFIDPEGMSRACRNVEEFIDTLGWQIHPTSRGTHRLAAVLAGLQRLGCDCNISFFAPYADAAERLAVQELELLPPDAANVDRAAAVVRTILLESALSAIRRMAQEHYLALRFRSA